MNNYITRRAVELAGGPKKVGERIGKTRQAVNDWFDVPPKHVLILEEMSGISRYDLRPDIYGPPPHKCKPSPRTVAA